MGKVIQTRLNLKTIISGKSVFVGELLKNVITKITKLLVILGHFKVQYIGD